MILSRAQELGDIIKDMNGDNGAEEFTSKLTQLFNIRRAMHKGNVTQLGEDIQLVRLRLGANSRISVSEHGLRA